MRFALHSCTALLGVSTFLAVALAQDAQPTASHQKLEALFGQLIDGGEWRAPNPAFGQDERAAKEFILRYRWGPHEQHMIGELLGLFESDGNQQETLFWSLYAVHNPVTDEVQVSQIGANGTLAAGRAYLAADDKHVIEQILYGADGALMALRHEETFAADGLSYTSDVFERDSQGGWKKVRDWIWSRR